MAEENTGGSRRGQLVLEFDSATFALKITGSVQNLNMALSMLDQAKRELERQATAAAVRESVSLAPGGMLPFLRGKTQ